MTETVSQVVDKEAQTAKLRSIHKRFQTDFEHYAFKCLKILNKPDQVTGVRSLVPFKLNQAQQFIHARLEQQIRVTGMVRAVILKGRQQGASTYVEGRFYWKTSMQMGQKTYILTHKQEATDNLFGMVERYHQNTPGFVRPIVGKSNAKEFEFPGLESSYQVATAGAKGAGRSATLINVHGSEVGFWEKGESHLSGLLQAVPLAPGTEVVLESTANGVGDVFHKVWQQAEAGTSDFIAIFVPWYWQNEYRRQPPEDFILMDDEELVPEGELVETEYAKTFKLDNEQMFWRRMKIVELGGGEEGYWQFKQEYPATADEAFQAANVHSLISRRSILKARKSNVATEGDLIIGVDPAGQKHTGDKTAIVRRRTRRIFNPQSFNGLSTMQIAALLQKIIVAEKPTKMFIDVGGMGVGIYDRLMELKGTAGIVVPVNFGEAALNPDEYQNRRVEMYYLFMEWLDDPGGANIPDDDEFQADCLAVVPDDDDSNQRKRLKSKKWMRQNGIRSPNLADGSVLTFAQPVGAGSSQMGNASTDFDPLSGEVYQGNQGSSLVDFDPFN